RYLGSSQFGGSLVGDFLALGGGVRQFLVGLGFVGGILHLAGCLRKGLGQNLSGGYLGLCRRQRGGGLVNRILGFGESIPGHFDDERGLGHGFLRGSEFLGRLQCGRLRSRG